MPEELSPFNLTGTTSDGGNVSIGYSYDPAAADLDFLRVDESLTITYTVKVDDGTVDSGTQTVTFTITGTNDAPILSDTAAPTAVVELGDASAQDLAEITGSFTVADADVGDTAAALDGIAIGSGADVADGALSAIAIGDALKKFRP